MNTFADIYFVENPNAGVRDPRASFQTFVPLRTVYVLPQQTLLEALLSNEKVLALLSQLLLPVQPTYAKPAEQQSPLSSEVAATD